MEANQLVYKCLVGSKAYGTDTPESDTDYKGIYIQPNDDILGFNYKQQVDVGKDECYYEIRRFIELAASANPTILEMLFMPKKHQIIRHPCLDILFENRHKFITQKCFKAFGGYAYAQIQKARGLNKKMNWEKEKIIRKTPIDFCYMQYGNGSKPLVEVLKNYNLKQEFCGLCAIDHMPNCYLMYYDYVAQYGAESNTPEKYPILGFKGIAFEDSNDIRLSSIPKDIELFGIIYYNKDAYSIHCKDYLSYTEWLEKRNKARYVDIENHGQQIDGKNMLHCIRLLDCCIEIGQTGEFQVERSDAKRLLRIRKGEVSLESILVEAEGKLNVIDKFADNSTLPKELDMDFAHNLLIQIRNKWHL